MNSVVLVESQGSCALVRIVRLQKFDRRDNMIFTVHLNRLIDENTPLEQSTIETCLQEAYKYQKVTCTKISCDIGSRFEASWLDCVTMMSEMTIAVIVVSASCHHLTRADSGWSRISWFSRVTLPWLWGGTSVAPWRHKCSHVPLFRRLFDRLPVRISTSDLHHRILQKKLYHIRAYDFGVQFSFKYPINMIRNPKCLTYLQCTRSGESSLLLAFQTMLRKSRTGSVCCGIPKSGQALNQKWRTVFVFPSWSTSPSSWTEHQKKGKSLSSLDKAAELRKDFP